jgi:hypothetical protein
MILGLSPKRIHEFQIADHLIDLLPNEYDGNEPIFPKLYSDNEKQLNLFHIIFLNVNFYTSYNPWFGTIFLLNALGLGIKLLNSILIETINLVILSMNLTNLQ